MILGKDNSEGVQCGSLRTENSKLSPQVKEAAENAMNEYLNSNDFVADTGVALTYGFESSNMKVKKVYPKLDLSLIPSIFFRNHSGAWWL